MSIPFVFISYSHSDVESAARLSARLRSAGIPHFRDLESIDWGEDIPVRIHEALERATHLLVLISPGSEKSPWVAYEMGFAKGRKIIVVPYLLHSQMDLPGFISSKRYIRDLKEERRFIANLKRRLPKKGRESSSTIPGDPIDEAVRRSIKDAVVMLENENPRVRGDAVEILVGQRAKSELLSSLGHKREYVRAAAAEGCSRLRAPEAIPYLVGGMHDVSSRNHNPVIPGAEKAVARYGAAAVPILLADAPKGWREEPRWIEALSETIDRASGATVLDHARRVGGGWLLEPLLKAKMMSVSPEELEPVLSSELLEPNGDTDYYRLSDIAGSMAGSVYRTSPVIQSRLRDALQKVAGQLKRGGSWGASKATEAAANLLNASIVDAEDLEEAARAARLVAQNRELAQRLEDLRRDWLRKRG